MLTILDTTKKNRYYIFKEKCSKPIIFIFQGVPGFDNSIEGPKGLKGEPGRQVTVGFWK